MSEPCDVCLSRGRRLSQLGSARANHLRCVLGKGVTLPLEVCWECLALVDKSIIFFARVRRTSKLLTAKFTEATNSALSIVTKVGYDFEFCSDTNIFRIPVYSDLKKLQINTFDWNLPIHPKSSIDIKLESDKKCLASIKKETPKFNDNAYQSKSRESSFLILKGVKKIPELNLLNKIKQISQNNIAVKINSCNSTENKNPSVNSILVQPNMDKKRKKECIEDESDPTESDQNEPFSDTAEFKVPEGNSLADEESLSASNSEHNLDACDKASIKVMDLKDEQKINIYDFLAKNPNAKIRMNELCGANLTTRKDSAKRNFGKPVIKSKLDAVLGKEIFYVQLNSGRTKKSAPRKEGARVFSIYVSEKEMLESREEERNDAQYVKSLFRCETCILSFVSPLFLEEHNQSQHNQELPHSCDICTTRFAVLVGIENHRLSHYKRCVCSACGFTHRKAHLVKRHYHTEHDKALYPCRRCDQTFLTRYTLNNHQDEAHPLPKKCSHCNKQFLSPHEFKSHLKAHRGGDAQPYECAVCWKRVRGKSLLAQHMRAHATPAPDDAYCAKCGVQYRTSVAYKAHLATSPRHVAVHERRYPCDKCEKRFTAPCRLRKHYDFAHLNKQTHMCDDCDKNFSTSGSLNRHRQTVHEGKKSLKNKLCDVCNRGFATATLLATHKRIHTGERPFACDICGDTFRQKASLYTHKRVVHLKLKKKKS